MKHLFNNLSQDEKQSILEMHKGTKMVFSEQSPQQTAQQTPQSTPIPWKGQIKVGDTLIWDGAKQVPNTEELIKSLQKEAGAQQTGIFDIKLYSFLYGQRQGTTDAGGKPVFIPIS